MAATAFSVTLHHLAPGARAAGLHFPDEQLLAVNPAQLRDLLYALGAVASTLTIYEPSTPEIRIKTERDVFIVRTRYRQLCFVGWEAILRGEEHSVSFILTTITGTAEPIKAAPKVERVALSSTSRASNPPVEKGASPRWIKLALLGFLIVGINGVTAWMLLRPPPSLLPKHELLSASESQAVLIKAAGEYETGLQPGNRRMVIQTDGRLIVGKYGPQQAVVEQRTKQVRGALIDGHEALITADAVLTIKDADTVVYFGSTYHRHQR